MKKAEPQIDSWVSIPEQSDFSIYNLPYGIFRYQGKKPRVGVAIGTQILDLAALHRRGYLDSLYVNGKVFRSKKLNKLIAQGPTVWSKLRALLQDLLRADNPVLRDASHLDKILIPQEAAEMLLPISIGDYTDFYSSMEHATNVGKMFRPDGDALLPNWKHLPVGYHGRSGSIIPSGVPIRRPYGQILPDGANAPVFDTSKAMDFELEMGFVVGKPTSMGDRVAVDEAYDHIFGMMLLNDWSARDLQKWEYVPLGPFLGKNFASSVSPWIVPMEALQPFRTAAPEQNPDVLPYLKEKERFTFDIQLQVHLAPKDGEETLICTSNFKYLYWTMAQQLAHHTINGCNLRLADFYASGTISGARPDSYGSMLELTWRGTQPLTLSDGSQRKFLQDNDTVIMRGFAEKGAIRVGFGEVRTTLLPAIPWTEPTH